MTADSAAEYIKRGYSALMSGGTIVAVKEGGRSGGTSHRTQYPGRFQVPFVAPSGLILLDGGAGGVTPFWVSRSAYYQSVTFSCDYYCSETWRTFGPVAAALPEIAAGAFMCYRYWDCSMLSPETVGSIGPDFITWALAEGTYINRRASNEPLFYPYSSYPLGK